MQLRKNSSLLIAGTGGDSGKTLVSLSLTAYFKSRGLAVAAYKKGPDYIDAAWLKWASGKPARNLDTYMVDKNQVKKTFFENSADADISIIEGNRGLYDGMDEGGTHSSAELAKLLGVPVLLIVNAAKVTRTTSAIVLGCQKLDPQVNIAGVIFNRTAGSRHESVLRKSLEAVCEIPVAGFLPKLKDNDYLPGRHLGLVTPEENPYKEKLAAFLPEIAEKYLDVKLIREIAGSALINDDYPAVSQLPKQEPEVKICCFADSAFSFYYPENIEDLEKAGAEIVRISSLTTPALPDCGGLYLGGGFPETHISELSKNRSLMASVKNAAENGLPVYAECGGLMYLCDSLRRGDEVYPLAGVFPLKLKMEKKPQGHGYCEAVVESDNIFYRKNAVLRGHEFHYSRILESKEKVTSCLKINRGTGCFDQRDGLLYKNVFACYLHIHSKGCPEWSENFVQAARDYCANR